MLFNTRTYNLDRVASADSVAYAGPDHTFSSKDILELSRVYPKPTSTYAGNARPKVRRIQTVTVNATTGEKADMIVKIDGSVPVGTAAADVDAMLTDLAAWINTADAKALFKALDVNA